MRKAVLFAVTIMAASVAMADSDKSAPINNNYNNSSASASAGAIAGAAAGAIATGGHGGNGYGGSAIATGGQGGAGGYVRDSGNSNNLNSNSNSNRNDNSNSNRNAQGQLQGQTQSSRNDNSNSNAGNNSSQNVTVQGDTWDAARIPVSTAYSGNLTSSNGACMGSSSAGAQGVGFGLSFGTTWTDTSCDMRYDAEALRLAGLPRAALARLCQKSEIASAMEASGTPCPAVKVAPLASVATAPGAQASTGDKGYTGTDPIVRARLGLPPL